MKRNFTRWWWSTIPPISTKLTNTSYLSSLNTIKTTTHDVGLTLGVRIPLGWGVLNTTLCDKVCQWLVADLWFSLGTLVSFTNKTDRHDITEIMLKGVKHHNPNPPWRWKSLCIFKDEYGTAAYKTVELDTFLNDAPIQHREVQGHESELFKSYFDNIT
jgi:hypothetical protein